MSTEKYLVNFQNRIFDAKNSSVITGMAARGGGDIERDFLAQRGLHDYRGVYRYHLSNIGYTSTQVYTIS